MEGEFDGYGGRHVPDPLEEPLAQLAAAFDEIVDTDEFQSELQHYLQHFGGRPTPIFYAQTLSDRWGAEIYFKHEDLLHGGAQNSTTHLDRHCWQRRQGRND